MNTEPVVGMKIKEFYGNGNFKMDAVICRVSEKSYWIDISGRTLGAYRKTQFSKDVNDGLIKIEN